MFDLVRTSLHRVLTTPALDGLLPVRVPRDLARRLNVALGEPICSKGELVRRREARAKLAELTARGREPRPASGASGAAAPVAPVMVYVEGDRGARLLGRIKELLDAKSIAYTVLDVTGDPTTKDFVVREAKCKEDDLPIVFVAGTAIGGYNELVDADVSGRLAKALRGAS